MAPRRRTVAFLVIAVGLGLILGIAVDITRTGGIGRWLARHQATLPMAGEGRLVDIGGRSLYIDCRGSGSPTVILEAGMGGGISGWASVHDGIAASTRTCAYDRAGRGSSDPRGRHTLADAATDLRTLLLAAGEPGPFIVVGHSLGGDYARIFADRHRGEVAGVVLIDAFTPDLESAYIHPLLGDLRPQYEVRLDGLRAQVALVEDLDWIASEAQLRNVRPIETSVAALSAPRYEPRLDEATNQAIADAWIASYEAMSPGNVSYELAWGAGHMIQDDRPDLVIATVRELVDSVRSR